MTPNEAHDLGRSDAKEGKFLCDNPFWHQSDGDCFAAWRAGWIEESYRITLTSLKESSDG